MAAAAVGNPTNTASPTQYTSLVNTAKVFMADTIPCINLIVKLPVYNHQNMNLELRVMLYFYYV